MIFCEDTRVTAKLAARFGLAAPRVSCPAPREKSRVADLLRRLAAGRDGGRSCPTPGCLRCRIRERGSCAAASGAGFPVRVVPGPLRSRGGARGVRVLRPCPTSSSGSFPPAPGERRRVAGGPAGARRDPRLVRGAASAASSRSRTRRAVLGPRRACVARELTKLHEETLRGTLAELAASSGPGRRSAARHGRRRRKRAGRRSPERTLDPRPTARSRSDMPASAPGARGGRRVDGALPPGPAKVVSGRSGAGDRDARRSPGARHGRGPHERARSFESPGLTKVFRSYRREEGLGAALKSLVRRTAEGDRRGRAT